MPRPDPAPMVETLQTIRTFIKQQADDGATWAHIHIHNQFIDYQDDTGEQRRFHTEHIDRDLIISMDSSIECYVAPKRMHIHLSNHAKGRMAMNEPHHRHILGVDHNAVSTPETTQNGRFMVHLAYGRRMRDLTIINPDGTAASRNTYLSMRHTQNNDPGTRVETEYFTIRAIPQIQTKTPAEAGDIDHVITTAYQMLFQHMKTINSDPEAGSAWATADTRDRTPDELRRLLPDNPQTCAMYHGEEHGYHEILPPENAAVPVISHVHGSTVATALDQYSAEDRNNPVFVSVHAERMLEAPTNPIQLPTVHLIGVEVTEKDGSITRIQPPRYPGPPGHDHEAYPSPGEERLTKSRTARVKAITLDIERREHGQPTQTYWIPADTYVDQDESNFVILATEQAELTPDDVDRMVGLGFQANMSTGMDSFHWMQGYHANLLCQEEDNQANRMLLHQIAATAAKTGARPDAGTQEASATSDDGAITVTLRNPTAGE